MPKLNRTYHKRHELVDGHHTKTHPLYTTWASMLARCYNKNNPYYAGYGGRRIEVDPSWWHFKNFASDMGAKPTAEHTLERVNNNKGYSKENCIWQTRTEQCVNRRTFKNNTSGETGVVDVGGGRFSARFDYERVRYEIGRYGTADEAAKARADFIELFRKDKSAAEKLATAETIWATSSTGVRGVVPHADGGFIVRVTVKGVRKYIGYFKTLEEAIDARRKHNSERT